MCDWWFYSFSFPILLLFRQRQVWSTRCDFKTSETLSFAVMSRLSVAIYRAFELNDSSDVLRLLELGADVDEVNAMTGMTLLHCACIYLNPAVIESFLRLGADIDIVTSNSGFTALQKVKSRPSISPNRVAVLQLMATCAQTRLEASLAEWIRLAQNEPSIQL